MFLKTARYGEGNLLKLPNSLLMVTLDAHKNLKLTYSGYL